MKLNSFNAANTANKMPKEAFLAMNRQGQVTISEVAVEAMGFKSGDKVAVHQDEENPEDWYIGKDENGFVIRPSKGTKNLCFNSSMLVKTMLDSLGMEDTHSCAFKLTDNATEIEGGVRLFPVITSQVLRRRVYADPEEEEEENNG